MNQSKSSSSSDCSSFDSRGGVSLRCFEPPWAGAEVTIPLHRLDHPSLLRAGRVAWVKRKRIPAGGWQAGITFHNELTAAIVSRLVTQRASVD